MAIRSYGNSARITRRPSLRLAPHTSQRSLDFLLETSDQFAVAVDQRLLGFDFSDDGLLGGEGWEGDLKSQNMLACDARNCSAPTKRLYVVKLCQQQRINEIRFCISNASPSIGG